MSSIYSIYRITNKLNNKIYIGFDSCWPKRKYSHRYFLNKRNQHLYFAFRKYGWDNFIWDVIYQSKDGQHCLNVMENYFINEYDSFKKGYNETRGGEGTLGRISKESTKIKISQKLKNKPKSKEHIEKMASTRKGKVPSEESLKKRSESMKKTLAIKKQLMQNL